MNSKRLAVVVSFALIGVGAAISMAQQSPHSLRTNDVGAFMKLKLEATQPLLGGIVTEDWDAVRKQSQQLQLLSQEASWQVLQTPEYANHSVDFRRAANSIKLAADEKDIDAATLAYMELTMKCVACHKHVRSAGR